MDIETPKAPIAFAIGAFVLTKVDKYDIIKKKKIKGLTIMFDKEKYLERLRNMPPEKVAEILKKALKDSGITMTQDGTGMSLDEFFGEGLTSENAPVFKNPPLND